MHCRGHWIIVIIMVMGMGLGCRAMRDKGGPTPAPAPSESPKPVAASPTPPVPVQVSPPPILPKDIDSKDYFRIDLLREGLGRSIVPLLNPSHLSFDKLTEKSASSPNFLLESGNLRFDQVLGGISPGESAVHLDGPYQKLSTSSGSQVISFGPVTVNLNVHNLNVSSACGYRVSLTGQVRCTLSGVFDGSTQMVDATGQCMTHSNGTLDNLRVDVGSGNIHTVRYAVGVKIHGSPLDWKAYTWSGSPHVNGLSAKLPTTTESQYECEKQ